MWATFVIFTKLPIVNNRALGENSPNLVTLFGVTYCLPVTPSRGTKSLRPVVISTIGANFDLHGRSWPPEVNFVPYVLL
jgi:hypothetical protein